MACRLVKTVCREQMILSRYGCVAIRGLWVDIKGPPRCQPGEGIEIGDEGLDIRRLVGREEVIRLHLPAQPVEGVADLGIPGAHEVAVLVDESLDLVDLFTQVVSGKPLAFFILVANIFITALGFLFFYFFSNLDIV